MTGALDECGGLVDRVRELHLVAGGVVVEPASAIPHQIADDERHLDCVAAEARLIAAHDHIVALRVEKQLPQAGSGVKVIAGATVIDVVAAWFIREPHPRDHLGAAAALNVEAEHLLAFVVLRPPAVGTNRHRCHPFSLRPLNIPNARKSSRLPLILTIGVRLDDPFGEQRPPNQDPGEDLRERMSVTDVT